MSEHDEVFPSETAGDEQAEQADQEASGNDPIAIIPLRKRGRPRKIQEVAADGFGAVARFRVSLAHNPTLDVEAADRDEAISCYNVQLGIVDTTHKYQVVRVR